MSDSAPDTAAPAAPGDLALPLLGMIAYFQLAAFTRLAADSGLAPTLTQRLSLAGYARNALNRVDRVAGRIVELGGDPQSAMRPFAGVLVEFDERTEPSTWSERLLKSYVGYGVADDFARVLAEGLDPASREVVDEVMSDDGHGATVVAALEAAGADDATLSPRLALWGRRLVGESLGVVQRVLGAHPEVVRLLAGALPGDEPQSRLFARLTAEHTRRMDRLGLAA
ncbi:ferritin-like fold-containing protein [Isoptericola sp. b441]|uniref:Ferritin-like fold-containing protein n=1 Tax=Actinotalea lenta TaxID=3064654 RepID=A0ABT9DCI9_9CELL|nr:ferritin-like fold-containing protein [Isoptericola sp. b441]MDO8108295.1 ferritin-like fold-containing protein [Isoptericola sp. b441]